MLLSYCDDSDFDKDDLSGFRRRINDYDNKRDSDSDNLPDLR